MDDKEKEILKNEHNHGNIEDINISKTMKTSFLSYAMSVIVARALPDVRDGLKPVQRRILFAMNELGMYSDKPHKKSARIVGEVIGKYHPHGDSSVYEAMVRMAQPFNLNATLVDGHGNFGSVDGDGAAAMRYTEARMSKISMELVKDLDKDTVDFQDNYDASEREPSVLPSKFPNLLVNGSTGIAVGMATNIPSHNLFETIQGVIEYIKNRDITTQELMEHIKGPDFATGGQILGLSGLRKAYETGQGIIRLRATTEFIKFKNKTAIVVTEIPYQVNKSRLIEKIAECAKNKIVDGIVDLRDESNRKGMRIVIELRKDVNPDVMLNNLYKYTQLQASFGINMIALVNGEPKILSLKEVISNYVLHQFEIIQRRTKFDLEKALQRKHILEGQLIALNDVDNVIKLIKESKTASDAKDSLMEKYNLSEIQAKSILDIRLQKLTSLEVDKLKEEDALLSEKIIDYRDILQSDSRKENIIIEELSEIQRKFSTPRKTTINQTEDIDIEDEDLIKREEIIITLTKNGYIKRMTPDVYRSQGRGGVGMSGIKVHEDDYVEQMISAQTHDYILFFTTFGRIYRLKGYLLPAGSRQAKGLPIINLLNLQEGEKIASITKIESLEEKGYLCFITKKGLAKKTEIIKYKNVTVSGINAISLDEEDELLSVKKTDGNQVLLIGNSAGNAIKFLESKIRPTGRNARGVKIMRLRDQQLIVGADVIDSDEQEVLILSENGMGKKTKASEFSLTNRGGVGVRALKTSDKTGMLSAIRVVDDAKDLIIGTDLGMTIRVSIKDINLYSRAAQGTIIIRLKQNQKVSTVAIVDHVEDEEENIEKTNIEQEKIELVEEKTEEVVDLKVEE